MLFKEIYSSLQIEKISLMVSLGCTEEERSEKQEIHFNIKFGFTEPPPCEKTDLLTDTICYSEVSLKLANFLKNREYNLIESMGFDCLNLLREIYPKHLIQVCLHKLKPPISAIKGGVKYNCGDFFET